MAERTELVLDALDMAVSQRQPAQPGPSHRSRLPAQYTSLAFGRRLRGAGLVASVGTVGDALDNAVAENFFATLECELLDRHAWPTRQGLRTAVFELHRGLSITANAATRPWATPAPASYEQQRPSPSPAA